MKGELPQIKRVAFYMVHSDTRQVLTLRWSQKIPPPTINPKQERKLISELTIDDVDTEEWTIEYQEPRRNDLSQCWLFRYDCIVNQEHPDIVLDPSDSHLLPRPFTGLSTQQLCPQICGSLSEDLYFLKTSSIDNELFVMNTFGDAPE